MSSSFVEFRAKGFWSWDRYLEAVLPLLADALQSDSRALWLADIQRHWREQSSGIFAGFINLNLDEFLQTEERRLVLSQIVEGVKHQPGVSPEAKATLELLEALLRGELNTDASSPLDYMVQGTLPDQRMRKE